MQPRLKTEFWVKALIARAQSGGANCYVVHKGDNDAGAVLLKISAYEKLPQILSQSRNLDGEIIFVDISNHVLKGEVNHRLAEIVANEYADKRISQDRDLWFIEIEDKLMRNFLTEAVK